MAMLGDRFRRRVLPGLIFQSVLVGGGYATGRELVEFFLSRGPWAGLLGMLVAMLVWSTVLAISFEFARVTRSYDYRTFFGHLLGPGWVLFELVYLTLALLVLSVLGSATGELVQQTFGSPPLLGAVALMSAIGVLAFLGSDAIERFLATWSIVLYAAYALYFALWIGSLGGEIAANFTKDSLEGGWFEGGVTYAGYNMVGVIAVLFCLRHLETRRDAVVAGVVAGPLAMIPGLLFYVAMVGFHPEVIGEPVPVSFMLAGLEIPALQILFQLVLLGTFIETGLGLIHALNERIAVAWPGGGSEMPRWVRPMVATAVLAFSIFLATELGIISLVASGYGTLTYLVLAIYVLPMLTLGLWRIANRGSEHSVGS